MRESSEDEVFSIWLKAEFEGSERFAEPIADILKRLDVFRAPDFSDVE